MRIPTWLRGSTPAPSARRRLQEARRRARKLRIESLEDRVVPSADTLVPNLTTTVVSTLRTGHDKILGAINTTGNAFDTPIPGVLQTFLDKNHDGTVDDKDTHVPTVADALSVNVKQNLAGAGYPSGVAGSLGARYAFIKTLGVGGAEQALASMDLDGNKVVDVTELVDVLVFGAMQDRLNSFVAVNPDNSLKTISPSWRATSSAS
jgi:hypothetical protein